MSAIKLIAKEQLEKMTSSLREAALTLEHLSEEIDKIRLLVEPSSALECVSGLVNQVSDLSTLCKLLRERLFGPEEDIPATLPEEEMLSLPEKRPRDSQDCEEQPAAKKPRNKT